MSSWLSDHNMFLPTDDWHSHMQPCHLAKVTLRHMQNIPVSFTITMHLDDKVKVKVVNYSILSRGPELIPISRHFLQ